MKDNGSDKRVERPRVVDVLLVGNRDAWTVIARPGDDHSDLFTDGGDPHRTVPMLLCRSVGKDGELIIGAAEPGQDVMLSELLLWDCPDEA